MITTLAACLALGKRMLADLLYAAHPPDTPRRLEVC